ncbi:SDR family NAD(P)-dependent oxidoreductase [Caballeronia sp. LZ019]|uniref:SDR family NAD(P)-dependent oxidoreductase n=1 Tax=Caballeronia sp. LZ019 TaxID=3038555 RepID=UPI0028628372|nr:SDR family NAD(P)-dependent oxidoreductase [Caballeronia sp. LZ019]MDR5809214.1 SDR family NAD(P)-dependent oxidoreductase [Caballeronia sp. LZ019]
MSDKAFEKSQTAIVTGGARGLGLGIAKRLAAEGKKVILWDLDFRGFDSANAGFEPFLIQQVDVADLGSVQTAFAQAKEAAGHIQILVNNAGINGPIHPTWEYPSDAWKRVLEIDLMSVFYCCSTVIPQMRESGYGRIVNVASIAGKEGNPGGSAYAAAKGGVIAYTKSIAKELAGSGVLANCIAPTMADTELLKQMTPEFISTIKAKIPMGRFVTIEEVAAMVSWIAGPECSFTTGFTFDLTGGRATY